MSNTHVESGDHVSLVDEKQRCYIIDTTHNTDRFKGVGVFNPAELIGLAYGSRKIIGTKQFWVLPLSLPDALQGLKRNAQIILPKDAAQIIVHCSITSGSTILEAGIGSGALTTILAASVAPTGHIISYDNREEFIDHAMNNLKQACLDKYVTTHIQDVTKNIFETDLDAIILDIPNPWDAINHAWNALRIGGYLCTYSPLISQVEQSVKKMQSLPFIQMKTIELLEREMIVSVHGTRPSFHMLGHSGYLTFARKIDKEKKDENEG